MLLLYYELRSSRLWRRVLLPKFRRHIYGETSRPTTVKTSGLIFFSLRLFHFKCVVGESNLRLSVFPQLPSAISSDVQIPSVWHLS